MSLFNLVTWWSTQCPSASCTSESDEEKNAAMEETFCLCVSRFSSFDSAESDLERESIFVGSSTGHLGVYQPTNSMYEYDAFSPTDVVLEQNLNAPILQILCGKFAMTRNDNRYCLAVLHPYKLACYWIVMADGIANHGKQFKLNLAFEINLKRHAFWLCKGGFGGVLKKEFLCVNHLDSSLRFFEQDGIATEGRLPPGRTIPSPVLYLNRVDCFALVALPWETLECYKYQDLIQSSEGKPISPIWTYCLGEFVLDMATHQITNSESVIVILGEHNLICLTDTGVIKFVKKLDYTPISFFSFVIGWYYEPDARLMIAIATDMTLFLYEFTKLVWSTKLPFVPVAMSRASFDRISGALILLSDSGLLHVAFFGTDPQTFKVPPLASASINVKKAQEELLELEEDIKRGIDFSDLSFVNAAASRDLQVSVNRVPINRQDDQIPRTALIEIKLLPKVIFDQIQILIVVPYPLKAKESSFNIQNTEPGTELEFQSLIANCLPAIDPVALEALVIISAINRQGIPRIIEKKITLPLDLVFEACQPQKDAKYKVTITSDSTKSLSALFPEFTLGTNQQALGLNSMFSGSCVTIVLAKNTNRYRIQSDELSSVHLVLQSLVTQLEKQNAHQSSSANPVLIHQHYFVDELLSEIERHTQQRKELKEADFAMEKLSLQMRLFQKKMTLKMQEDPPDPTFNSAAKLLRLTNNEINELEEVLKRAVLDLRLSQARLGNQLELARIVVRYSKTALQLKDLILATFMVPIVDWIEISWEETVAPCLEMLKTKNQDSDDIVSYSQIPYDLGRFKKNVRSLFDKLEKSNEVENTSDLERKLETIEDSDWLDHTDKMIIEDQFVV